ncbi:MAG: hypothetical protein Barrevirus2_23 [Barrevirus sp.]|uniref:Uncharacterized protein n=1 Tax=Barrevirus sp. TaxID=2487763 RepID=A0A3G4ZPP1_9VIRU|nr:MAG: hypothetical protein Barrevirus2_23 [Barrevirus sp.]
MDQDFYYDKSITSKTNLIGPQMKDTLSKISMKKVQINNNTISDKISNYFTSLYNDYIAPNKFITILILLIIVFLIYRYYNKKESFKEIDRKKKKEKEEDDKNKEDEEEEENKKNLMKEIEEYQLKQLLSQYYPDSNSRERYDDEDYEDDY